MSIINDAFRWILWWVVEALLTLLDIVFDFTKTLLALDYLNLSDDIWMWFTILAASFTAIFAIFRLVKNYMLDAVDASEDREPRINISRLVTRIIALELVIMLAQPMLSGLSWVSSGLVQNINIFTGTESDTLSAVILEAGGIEVDADGNWSIDINTKEDGEYVYFSSSFELAFLIIVVVLGAYQMFFIVLGIGERFVSMLVKLILAPWAFSSIVEPVPQNFATWCRLFLADFFGNFVVCFMLVAGCSVVMGMDSLSGLVKCILLISVLVGIQSAPQVAAHLIGADIGAASGVQSLRTLMSAKAGLSAGLTAVGGAAATGAAMGVYGIGRKLGGISRHDDQFYSGHDAKQGGSSGSSGYSGTSGGALDGIGAGSGSGSSSSSGGASTMAYSAGTDYSGSAGGGFGGSDTTTGVSDVGSVTKPEIDKNQRMAYDGTFAHRASEQISGTKGGKVATKLGSSMYQMSVRRLNTKEANKYGGYKKDAGRRATRQERRL